MKQKNNLRLTLICIIFTSIFSACKAQDKTRVESMHAKLNTPNGYALYENNLGNFWCDDEKASSGPMYTLIKGDKSVLISITANKATQKAVEISSKYIKNYSDEIGYINTYRNMADWKNHNVTFLPKNYLQKNFNADEGVMFTRGCKKIYEDKYPYNRHVLLMKMGQGFFTLTYLFTEEAKNTIEEEINNTAQQLVWFEDTNNQIGNDNLGLILNKMGATIQTPDGFIVSKEQLNPQWFSKDIKNIRQTFSNTDGSIVIAISLFPPNPAIEYLNELRIPNYNEKKLFLNSHFTKQDKSGYSTEYLQQNFNANAGIKFKLTCNSNKENKYPYGKAVKIMKNKRGTFQINYLYTEQVKTLIDSEIERTLPQLIKFDPSE